MADINHVCRAAYNGGTKSFPKIVIRIRCISTISRYAVYFVQLAVIALFIFYSFDIHFYLWASGKLETEYDAIRGETIDVC